MISKSNFKKKKNSAQRIFVVFVVNAGWKVISFCFLGVIVSKICKTTLIFGK